MEGSFKKYLEHLGDPKENAGQLELSPFSEETSFFIAVLESHQLMSQIMAMKTISFSDIQIMAIMILCTQNNFNQLQKSVKLYYVTFSIRMYL